MPVNDVNFVEVFKGSFYAYMPLGFPKGELDCFKEDFGRIIRFGYRMRMGKREKVYAVSSYTVGMHPYTISAIANNLIKRVMEDWDAYMDDELNDVNIEAMRDD